MFTYGRAVAILFALFVAVVACGELVEPVETVEPVDTDALIAEAQALEAKMDEIKAYLDRERPRLEQMWMQIEQGPGVVLNTRLEIADRQESDGKVFTARKTRADAQRAYDTTPLVRQTHELTAEYFMWEDLWKEKKLALEEIVAVLEQEDIANEGQKAQALDGE